MGLTPTQKKQVEKQLKAHEHKRYEVDIKLSKNSVIRNFVVYPNTWRPEIVTSIFLARFLFLHPELYRNKIAIDMGCGSGIQGIVMGLYGAHHVVFSDTSVDVVNNTKENVSSFGLKRKSVIVCGNLFENIKEKANTIVFNHPFFPARPIKNLPVSFAMLDEGKLLKRFLQEAKKHLFKDGIIVMPFFSLAGNTNNPKEQAPKYDYKIKKEFTKNVRTGLQKGKISIYVLSPK